MKNYAHVFHVAAAFVVGAFVSAAYVSRPKPSDVAKEYRASAPKSLTLDSLKWRGPEGGYRSCEVVYARCGGREMKGQVQGHERDFFQLHGRLDGIPFQAYFQFEP